MALQYTHQNRNVFALLSEREVPVVGGGVEVVEPAPVEVQGGEEPIARSSKTVATILVQATAARALPIVGGGVTVDAPAPVNVDGGAEAISRASQASATTLLAAETSRTLVVVGGGVTVVDPDPVTVQGGEESVARTTAATATQPVTATASRTLTVVGGGVTISKASPVDVQGGEEDVSRSTQSGSQVSIVKTFFPNSTLSADSNGCSSGGFVCDSDSAADSDTASGSSVAGKQATISFDVINCTANANGDVTARFLDGSGSEIASKTKSFTAAESGQTVTFSANAPSGTEQVKIDRSVSAQSFNDSGSLSCDGTCSSEGVLIDEDVTLTA